MSLRLSIIIPAYKVEDYIEKCIRSLEDQDVPKTDYEIIITNDGSPDRCKEIVESLQQEFSNIVLVNQENQGVSMARNNAIAKAKGQYIMPVDPDDYVVPQSLNKFLLRAEKYNLDILYLGFEIFDDAGMSIWKTDYSALEPHIYNGIDAYFCARGPKVKDPDRSWAILYRNDFLEENNITYPKGVPILEDGVFILKAFTVSQRVGFENKVFYQRTTRFESAINSRLIYSEKTIDGFVKAAYDVKKFGETYALSQHQKGLIHHGIVKYVLLALSSNMSIKSFGKYRKIVSKVKSSGFLKLSTQGVVSPYKEYATYFNRSAYLFFMMYFIVNRINKFLKISR
jgi:glycosyltransferase involved in cell wall biosynthesis